MAAALKYRLFADIIATKSYTTHGLPYVNHNKLLWNYDAALGGKTGYTSAAGRSLVSCAERDGLRLICVTLSDPDDWDDHSALCDWAFACFRCEYYPAGTVVAKLPVISGTEATVDIALMEDLRLAVPRESRVPFPFACPVSFSRALTGD
jgi:D-alanyl-D-alanine carboxypeptidase